MSHLQYYAYKGVGERNLQRNKYNQAVRVGDRIETSGQGGWDPETGVMSRDLRTQIEQAYANVDLNLKDAGGKGWSQVFKMVTYHVPMNNEALEIMAEMTEKWCPDHRPVWTAIGVQRLGEDDMRVEIDVIAHDPEAAVAATAAQSK